LRLADVDRAVWECLVNVINTPRLIIAVMEAQRASQDNSQVRANLTSVRERIAARDGKERKLLDFALASGDTVATDIFVEQQRAIRDERDGWRTEEQRLAVLVQAEEEREITPATIANITAYCARIRTDLASATFAQKRLVLDALHVQVTVDTRGGAKMRTVRGWVPAMELAWVRIPPVTLRELVATLLSADCPSHFPEISR
jgi:hypothetical protein